MASPITANEFIPWKPSDTCPCGSGVKYVHCCRNVLDKLPSPPIPDLTPPGDITNYAHERCYLKETNNCDTKISREHYISKSVLETYPSLTFGGFPWLEKGEVREFSINALTSKILCKRHNEALSPLDHAAGDAFRTMDNAMNFVASEKEVSAKRNFLISGDVIELWALKAMLGLFHARIFRSNGNVLLGDFGFDFSVAVKAFNDGFLEKPRGMFVDAREGKPLDGMKEYSPLISEKEKLLNGIKLTWWGQHIDFIFDTTGADDDYIKNIKNNRETRYRPWVLELKGKKRTSRVFFAWKGQRKLFHTLTFHMLEQPPEA